MAEGGDNESGPKVWQLCGVSSKHQWQIHSGRKPDHLEDNMRKLAAVFVAVVSLTSAQAVTLWDQGPATGGYGGSWANTTGSQEFADQVLFATPVTVTRFVYFTDFDPAGFGTMRVKLWSDNGSGNPLAQLSIQDVSVSSWSVEGVFGGATIRRVNLDLTTQLGLAANTTYWIGAAGNGFEAAQVSVSGPPVFDGLMAQFNGGSFSGHTGVGDQMFQLEGEPVPEPATMAVLGLGVAALLRRRRK